MVPEANLEVYEGEDVVKTYLHHQQLTKGEQVLFSRHASDYSGKKVLDLGVGAGRTTPALSEMAAEYWGVDYSQAMVKACQERFSFLTNARFVHDDARWLTHCPDDYFDAVIFSFNGIDVVDLEGRKAVIDTARRVLKKGGVFVFSFHNAGYLPTLYQYHWQKNPLRWWPNYIRRKRLRSINGPRERYDGKEYFIIKDGGEDFRLDICYVQPVWQQQMLLQAGFRLQHALESLSGKDVPPDALNESRHAWLYFRCTKA